MSRERQSWRMPAPCKDCPFSESAAGQQLRASLRPGRMEDIQRGLLRDQHFICHKTTDDTGDGSRLVCAGALAWQNEQGVSSQYQRICERLDAWRRPAPERES